MIAARHSEDVGRGRRAGWQRRYRVDPQPAAAGAMPEILVRDARSGRVVSRHRWRGDAYHPAIFDRLGPIGPG